MSSSGSSLLDRMRRYPKGDHDLEIRTLSALILGTITLAVTYAGVWPFSIFIAAFGAVMCWEWGRLVRGVTSDAWLWLHISATLIASFLTAFGYQFLALGVLGLTSLLLLAARGPGGDRLSALGVLYVGLPVVALIWLRSDAVYGLSAVLFVLVIVWTTDSAAYAFGRAIGGSKLIPSISPNKTWAGFIGGTVASMVAAAGFAVWLGGTSLVVVAIVGGLLAIAAQLGDLAESALKRNFGFKDSSGLIPGHGGLLDRVDGLVVAAPTAALLAIMTDPNNPGRALLNWP